MNTLFFQLAQGGFVLLTLACLILFLGEFIKAMPLTPLNNSQKKNFITRAIISLLLWIGFLAAWSLSGKMSDFSIFPLNLAPVIAIPLIVAVFFIRAKSTGEILKHIPPSNIIRLQSFRFFVEVFLWMLFIGEVLPVQMTFEGRNFDIIAGFTAPVVAVLVAKRRLSRTGIIIWNIACLVLLLNIVTIAILSTPSPWRVFMNEPPNYIVTHFPIAFLPGILVPLAYYLHFLSLRQMSNR